jgi:hypothetical protein
MFGAESKSGNIRNPTSGQVGVSVVTDTRV